MEGLTIGELARRAHVNRETVRYYERRKLLPRPSRTISGYRIFSDDALRRLRFVRHAKDLGFSLEEISELLALRVASANKCHRVRERTEAKIADIEKKIETLNEIKQALSELVAACSRRRKTNDCPILDNLEANGWFDQTRRRTASDLPGEEKMRGKNESRTALHSGLPESCSGCTYAERNTP
jgi:Hg(II)-responsive transcriptional regulator